MIRWLVAFLFTQLIEAPIYARALERPSKAHPAWRWAGALLPSAVTHPVVWFVFPKLVPGNYVMMVLAAEAFAVVVEGGLVWRWAPKLGLRAAMGWSLLANGLSVSLGFLSRGLFGWP